MVKFVSYEANQLPKRGKSRDEAGFLALKTGGNPVDPDRDRRFFSNRLVFRLFRSGLYQIN